MGCFGESNRLQEIVADIARAGKAHIVPSGSSLVCFCS
ncbi:MAG: hypothetical protein JWP94_2297 [Mucilaginibacter sp.]|jgi:hypothetical protein|nr:hypothetical protein [Mucilaginibacter sp.]